MWSQKVRFCFLVLYLCKILLLHAQVRVRVVVNFCIFRVREANTEHNVPYGTSMIYNVTFVVVCALYSDGLREL